jgi:hypothetical protein
MKMQVKNRLPGLRTGIRNEPVTFIGDALVSGDFGGG